MMILFQFKAPAKLSYVGHLELCKGPFGDNIKTVMKTS